MVAVPDQSVFFSVTLCIAFYNRQLKVQPIRVRESRCILVGIMPNLQPTIEQRLAFGATICGLSILEEVLPF